MKIAVDINDVLRKYTANFGEYFKKGYDNDINLDEVEITTNDLSQVFPFRSKYDYEKFVYEDYSWELFAKCDSCSKGLGAAFTNWVTKDLQNIDLDEPIEVMLVSPMEYGITIPSTYWFISKIGARVREVYFPLDSSTIWDKCDILITANPKLLAMKPEGKKTVKIKTDYNKDVEADFEFNKMIDFLEDNGNTESLFK